MKNPGERGAVSATMEALRSIDAQDGPWAILEHSSFQKPQMYDNAPGCRSGVASKEKEEAGSASNTANAAVSRATIMKPGLINRDVGIHPDME